MTSTRRLRPVRSACSSAVLTCTPTWCSPTTSTRASTAWRRSRWSNSKNAGVLGGGTLAAVSPKSTPAQIAAAVKWIDFYYIQPIVNEQQAIRYAKTQAANKQPIGTPEVPIFNQAQENLYNSWIKPYINVPLSQMAPFTTAIFKDQDHSRARGGHAGRVRRP